MANDPIDAPALWEYPSGPCGRPTKIGTLCPAGRAAASVYAVVRMGLGVPGVQDALHPRRTRGASSSRGPRKRGSSHDEAGMLDLAAAVGHPGTCWL